VIQARAISPKFAAPISLFPFIDHHRIKKERSMTDSPTSPLNILVFGAHPDDAEYHCGGLIALYREHGHHVKVISVTNGDAGHHQISGPELAERRLAELTDALGTIGATCEIWDHHDGHLQPTLELRWQIIAEIRRTQPDLVLTHRTNDYHPDHRAVGVAVQDASYMVTVPPIVPDVPALRRDPVIAYMPDHFTKPSPLQGDVVVDVGSQMDRILEMCHRHTSQTYEWLPYNRGFGNVPTGDSERKTWLRPILEERWSEITEGYRPELIATYGESRGNAIRFAEAYEISEYAASMDEDERKRLFPFLPRV
jgi:LmbE family N-acetylglucosaminyl deacetylase